MQNRETGKTYQMYNSPMGRDTGAEAMNALKTTLTPVQTNDTLNRLVTAYNSKAYANPYAPLLSNDTMDYTTLDGVNHRDQMVSASLRDIGNMGGGRLGFVRRDETPSGYTYGVGIDNIGDPYRGVMDKEVRTPLGTLGYGYDGDTGYAEFSPNNQTYNYIQALANLLYR